MFRLNVGRAFLSVCVLLVGSSPVLAQSQSRPVTPVTPVNEVELVAQRSAKLANAVSVEAPPTLDGDVLGDPVWAAADPVSGFRQSAPRRGSAGHGADRGSRRVHGRHHLLWHRLLRPRPLLDHRE